MDHSWSNLWTSLGDGLHGYAKDKVDVEAIKKRFCMASGLSFRCIKSPKNFGTEGKQLLYYTALIYIFLKT